MQLRIWVSDLKSVVELQWPVELSADGVEIVEAIYRDTDGVDAVQLNRYRHRLQVASFVASAMTVAGNIQIALLDNAELARVLKSLGLGELEVQVVPGFSVLDS